MERWPPHCLWQYCWNALEVATVVSGLLFNLLSRIRISNWSAEELWRLKLWAAENTTQRTGQWSVSVEMNDECGDYCMGGSIAGIAYVSGCSTAPLTRHIYLIHLTDVLFQKFYPNANLRGAHLVGWAGKKHRIRPHALIVLSGILG